MFTTAGNCTAKQFCVVVNVSGGGSSIINVFVFRMLLEVQTKLAQCEMDLRQAMEEVGQEKENKRQALAQLEQTLHGRESAEGRVQEVRLLQEQVEVLKQEREQLRQQMEQEQLRQRMEQEQHNLSKQLTEALKR